MATNKELQAAIAELSDANTEGMTNAEMVTLLAQLKEEEAATPATTADDYIVVEGKAITTLVGIVAHPRVVTAKMLSRGEEALTELVDAGICVKQAK